MSIPLPANSTPYPDPPPSSAVSGHGSGLLIPSDSDSPSPIPSTSRHATAVSSRAVDPRTPAAVVAHAQRPPAGPDSSAIEMDAVTPSSHRRRRSSLINPANGANPRHRSPRAVSRSRLGPPGVDDECKIVEESSDEVSLRPGELEDDDLTDEDLHDDEEAGLTGRDRWRKRRKRRRLQQLDQRVAGDEISPEEKKEADRTVVRSLLVNVALIGLWYFFSLLISLYNKWMFSPDKLNFRFPMFTTSVHFLVQFSLASLVLLIFPSLRPKNSYRSDLGQSRRDSEPERPVMTKLFYLTRIGPCGVATGLDIGLGNASLQFITLTFYTMCKSSSLAFVLLFAFLFRLEAPTWKLVGIIGTMTFGVVLMVAGEVEFKLPGFVLVIAAAFFSGFRWALTQILLLRNPATSNPFSSIFFLAPVMFVTLITIAIPVEGFGALTAGLSRVAEEKGPFLTPLILLFPGAIAFFMTASEFALLKRTSVVTLSIAGIFKEAVTITAAAVVFGDTMTAVNVVGLLITLVAIGAYNWIKINKMRNEAQSNVHRGHLAEVEESQSVAVAGGGWSGSGSDRDDDAQGEDMALLRRSVDNNSDVLFTADGGDLVAGPGPEVPLAKHHGLPAKDGRID